MTKHMPEPIKPQPTEVKKSSNKRVWIILGTIFGVLFLIGVVSGIVSPTDNTTTNNTHETEQVTVPANTEVDLATKAAAEEKAKADEAVKKTEEEAAAKKKAEEDKAKEEAAKELDADVRYSDTAFKITNKEAQNWTGCKFVLNGKLFGSDFTYKTSEGINANDSVIVEMSDFTKSDGTRFNPYSTAAKNLFLACDVAGNHRTGYYTIGE